MPENTLQWVLADQLILAKIACGREALFPGLPGILQISNMATLKSTVPAKKIVWLSVCLLMVFALFDACKKKDPKPVTPPTEETEDPDETETLPEGVDPAATGALSALIYLPYDQPLDTGQIEGLLGGREVALFYQPDSGLMLQIPFDSKPGVAKLTIPGIDGFEAYITIKDVALPGTAASVIAEMMEAAVKQAGVAQEAAEGDSVTRLKQYVDDVKNYIEGATVEEKERFATFYHINREWFLSILDGVQGDVSEPLPVGATYRAPVTLMQTLSSQANAATVIDDPEWERLRGTRYSYMLKAASERFLQLATRIRAIASDDLPERAAATLMAMQVGEYTSGVLEASFQSRPILYGASIVDNAAFVEYKEFISGDRSVRSEETPGGMTAAFTDYTLGDRDTLYFGIGLRSITADDRRKANRVHGQEHSAYLGIEAFFNGLDTYVDAAKLVNSSLALLKRKHVFSLTAPFVTYFGLHATNEIRLSMPEWMVRQQLVFGIGDRYQMYYHQKMAGGVVLSLNYAEGHGPTNLTVDNYLVSFSYRDDFSYVERSGMVGIYFPRPNRLDLSIANDEPPRLTPPYGRRSLNLKASVYPETTSQEVKWRIVKGGGLASVDDSGVLLAKGGDKLGYVTVRATSVRDSTVYADMDVKVTSYELLYIQGKNQRFQSNGYAPWHILYDVVDKLDGDCLPRGADTDEKLQVRVSSKDLEYNDHYKPYFLSYRRDWYICRFYAPVYVPGKPGSEWEEKLRFTVDLLQDGHVIDTDGLIELTAVHNADF